MTGAMQAGGAAAAAAAPQSAGVGRGLSARQLPSEQLHPPAPGQTAAAAKAPVAAPVQPCRRQQQQEPEIVPAPDTQSSFGGSGSSEPSAVRAGVEWLCQAQQQAVQAAADFLRPLLVRPAADEQGRRSGAPCAADFSPDPMQLAGGTVLGAVLLYALYAERQALRRGARRARRAVFDGAAQLLRMAFSLSINPAATSAPAWR